MFDTKSILEDIQKKLPDAVGAPGVEGHLGVLVCGHAGLIGPLCETGIKNKL
jgi:hypothetical protein